MMMTGLTEMVAQTPMYAWILLAVLIIRGRKGMRDNVLSFPRMLIIPAIFVVWGLETVVLDFTFPIQALAAYAASAVLGAFMGYLLYRRVRRFYRKDNVLYRSGTSATLIVSLLMFAVKYALNVVMSVQPEVMASMNFNLLYAMVSGFTVGLSMGGIYQAYLAVTGRLLSDRTRGAEL